MSWSVTPRPARPRSSASRHVVRGRLRAVAEGGMGVQVVSAHRQMVPDGARRDRPTTVQASRAPGRSRRRSGIRPAPSRSRTPAHRMLEHPATPAPHRRRDPHTIGRPTSTALAPECQRGEHVRAAPNATVHQHRYPSRDLRRHLGQGVEPAGDRSSWRPPWFETTIASATGLHGELGVLGGEEALDDHGHPGCSILDPAEVVPGDGRVEQVVARPDADRHHEAAARVAVPQPVDDEVDGPADRP